MPQHHHGHRQNAARRLGVALLEDRPMAQVHPIEVADGRHRATVLLVQIVQASNYFHESGHTEPKGSRL